MLRLLGMVVVVLAHLQAAQAGLVGLVIHQAQRHHRAVMEELRQTITPQQAVAVVQGLLVVMVLHRQM